MTRELHLGVDLAPAGHHPAAWRLPGDRHRLWHPGTYTALAATAEAARLDFIALGDSFAPPSGRHRETQGTLDAVAIAARIAPTTAHIGLLPTVTTTHTEPFHTSKAIATLDYVSTGRAGWEIAYSTTAAEAAHFGRKSAAEPPELAEEADEAAEAVTRLWDSWEDDAIIRDRPTGRFIDRDRLHYIDFTGDHFAVKGPSITPRPPQGQPLVAVRAEAASDLAARRADLVRIAPGDPDTAHAQHERLRRAAAEAGRDPDQVTVLADLAVHLADTDAEARQSLERLDRAAGRPWRPAAARFTGTPRALADLIARWHRSGAVDGFTILPAALPTDLDVFAERVVPLLQSDAGFRRRYPGTTFRDTFGLARPVSRYAEEATR